MPNKAEYQKYREKHLEWQHKDRANNRERGVVRARKYYKTSRERMMLDPSYKSKRNKIHNINSKKYVEMHPFRRRISSMFMTIKSRCNNPKATGYKYYGGRGIKLSITKQEVLTLWNRDGADLMQKPSIDRIDNDEDYSFDNCRFIEQAENSRRRILVNDKRRA